MAASRVVDMLGWYELESARARRSLTFLFGTGRSIIDPLIRRQAVSFDVTSTGVEVDGTPSSSTSDRWRRRAVDGDACRIERDRARATQSDIAVGLQTLTDADCVQLRDHDDESQPPSGGWDEAADNGVDASFTTASTRRRASPLGDTRGGEAHQGDAADNNPTYGPHVECRIRRRRAFPFGEREEAELVKTPRPRETKEESS